MRVRASGSIWCLRWAASRIAFPEGVFGLAHLPILTSTLTFHLLAEPAHLISQGLVRGRARQESANSTIRWFARSSTRRTASSTVSWASTRFTC